MIHFSQLLSSTFPTRIRAVAEILFRGTHEKLDEGKPRFSSRWRSYCSIGSLALVLVGCSSLKKAAMIGGGSLGAGAIASIATSGTAPVLLAGAAGASATSVVADVMTPSKKGGAMATAANCAETNFWDVIQSLFETAGWLLILVILVPMVLGWILPGPLERKKKK